MSSHLEQREGEREEWFEGGREVGNEREAKASQYLLLTDVHARMHTCSCVTLMKSFLAMNI